jgi:hypothetical protein
MTQCTAWAGAGHGGVVDLVGGGGRLEEAASVYGGRWKWIESQWSFDFNAGAVVEAAYVA